MSLDKKELLLGRNGSMRSYRYDLTEVGDLIEKHWYKGYYSDHTLFLFWGKILITFTGREPFELLAGQICDFPADAEYEIKVLEAPVRLVSTFNPNAGLEYAMQLCPSCMQERYGVEAFRPPGVPELDHLHEGV